MIILKLMQIQRTNCDEDMKAPPHKFYKRRKKKTKKTHMQASSWLDNHHLGLARNSSEDPALDLDAAKDRQLDLVRSNT